MLQLSEEFSAGRARLRVDVHGSTSREHVLEHMAFLNYRLASVHREPTLKLSKPDLVWYQDDDNTNVSYDGSTMTLTGEWAPGPLQKIIVTMLTLRMEAAGLHPFHAAAVRLSGRNILFLGGESNHGKSMALIEACRRGAHQLATETTVINDDGNAVMGSHEVFLLQRAKGTERADKAAPNRAVEKFFGTMPSWEVDEDVAPIDVVVVPAIDGNFDPSTVTMGQFESQFQTMHSMQNYLLLNELLAPGFMMPVVDTEALRSVRAGFAAKFTADLPFYFIRAATPQVLMDEVERVM